MKSEVEVLMLSLAKYFNILNYALQSQYAEFRISNIWIQINQSY